MSACVPLRLPPGCLLRSRGAETAATKRLFNISKEEYEARAAIVEGAYLYKGCAIATSDELDPAMSVVLPMAANDLLTINGVDASFVAIAKNGGFNISARSMGALNVQVILEPLGGGGHLTMAGAQLRDCTVKEAEARIRAQIDEYRANQECGKNWWVQFNKLNYQRIPANGRKLYQLLHREGDHHDESYSQTGCQEHW